MGTVLEIHREEREMLRKVLPRFDLCFDEYSAPGVCDQPNVKKRTKYGREKKGARDEWDSSSHGDESEAAEDRDG
jgi:hypothetical protein